MPRANRFVLPANGVVPGANRFTQGNLGPRYKPALRCPAKDSRR
jgi:hypothetical protein